MTSISATKGHRRNAEFLSKSDLAALAFASLGENVLIHATCVIVDSRNVSIGSNVRIDPFCVLSGARLEIGNYVHIAAHCMFAGSAPIILHDFSAVSHGSRVLASSDDFVGGTLIGPTIPAVYTNVISAKVEIGRFAILGANCVVLPGASIGEGSAIGALGLVKGQIAPWTVNVGCPARAIGRRERAGVLEMGEKLLRERGMPPS